MIVQKETKQIRRALGPLRVRSRKRFLLFSVDARTRGRPGVGVVGILSLPPLDPRGYSIGVISTLGFVGGVFGPAGGV